MIKWVAGATTILALVFGIWKIEDRYATAGDVAKEVFQLQQENVKQSVEIKELKDAWRYEKIQKRMWSLEDRYGCPDGDKCSEEILNEYRELHLDLKGLEKGEKSGP